jgi:hypothetical protein
MAQPLKNEINPNNTQKFSSGLTDDCTAFEVRGLAGLL